MTVIDGEIRRLLDGLIQRNIANCVNLIVVSDHGMADSPPGERLVRLSEYIPDLDKTAITFYGPVTSIRLINDTKGNTQFPVDFKPLINFENNLMETK